MAPWNKEEQVKLRSLHLDPIKNDREKLTLIFQYFKKGKGIWGITDGATGSLQISTTLARKIRDLTKKGALDWLMGATYEKDADIQKRQVEHIELLQQLARKAVDNVPLFFPDFKQSYDSEEFDEFNFNIVKVVKRLVGDHDWKDLAAHLGEEGIEIETICGQLNDINTNPDLKYEQTLDKIWFLLKHKGLKMIADNSDTKIWEDIGLNQKCANCPYKSPKP